MKKHSNLFITNVAILMLIMGFGLNWILQNEYIGIRKNISDSLPFTYFVSYKKNAHEKGLYVSIDHPKSSIRLAKKIIGIAGDRISISGQRFFINGMDYGTIKSNFSNGSHLTPIQESIIPIGYVFVYAPHSESFDSRYADFGLVNIQHLKEVLWPLF
jgi:conjugal transfer pilin signal peptidase TrbI